MTTFTTRKNKITLTDYNYRQDIENRLFMAELSIMEVDVLREIINGSLKTSFDILMESLDIKAKELKVILEKLSKSRLFKIQGENLIVDKEMRKYYEAQIIKFEDDFHPDLEYLQGLMNKVPIHALPLWYAIPRSSNNIFHSIVEKFLITPKTYERYLQELTFDDPVLTSIVKRIFTPPNYKVSSRKLIEELKLSREQFEEYMLFLEFSLVGCISYSKTKDIWEEVVTPFHEWRDLQLFIQNTNPPIIEDAQNIQSTYQQEFGYLHELNAFAKTLLKKEVPLKSLPSSIIDTAVALNIARVEKQKAYQTIHTDEWLEKSLVDQAIILYRQTLNRLLSIDQSDTFSEKDFREVEKNLKRLSHGGWIYFDDFIKGCLAAVGSVPPIYLQNKGRRWRYSIPQYQENELKFIQFAICDYLIQTGMVNTGKHKGKLCFCLTPFGKHSLG
jgi:hypothetical protein